MIRIYSEKTYFIVNPNDPVQPSPIVMVKGDDLRKMIKDGKVEDGEEIFKAEFLARAAEKKTIELEG